MRTLKIVLQRYFSNRAGKDCYKANTTFYASCLKTRAAAARVLQSDGYSLWMNYTPTDWQSVTALFCGSRALSIQDIWFFFTPYSLVFYSPSQPILHYEVWHKQSIYIQSWPASLPSINASLVFLTYKK